MNLAIPFVPFAAALGLGFCGAMKLGDSAESPGSSSAQPPAALGSSNDRPQAASISQPPVPRPA